jgi:hypothetical protein
MNLKSRLFYRDLSRGMKENPEENKAQARGRNTRQCTSVAGKAKVLRGYPADH